MNCGQIMKRDVQSVTTVDRIDVVVRTMRDREIGFLPVCGARARVLGVITDRDVVLRVCAEGRPLEGTTVAAVMTPDPVTCRASQSVALAERKMRGHRFTRLPIVDVDGALLGVLSLSDIAQYVRAGRAGRTLAKVAERKYAPERP